MAQRLSFEEVCDFLKEKDNFIILTHLSPDGDTLGSACALCHALKAMGKRACIRCADKIPSKYDFLFESLHQDDIGEGTVVAVDVATEKLLGSLWEEFDGRVDLCVDHHVSNTEYAERLLLDSDAAANCEIIYNIVRRLGHGENPFVETAIYTGITTDTGGFRFSNTTADTHRIAAEIMSRKNVNCGEINRLMFETKPPSQLALENYVLSRIKYYYDGKCAVLSIPSRIRKMYDCTEDQIEGLAASSRSIEGVMIGITVKQKDDGTVKASVRTHSPIDAAAICKALGGGGHIRAAGCSFNCSIPVAIRRILKVAKSHLEGNR